MWTIDLKRFRIKVISLLWILNHDYLLKQQIDSHQLYHRGAGGCSRRVENTVLHFCIVGGGGCWVGRLAGRQRRQRQNQLFTRRREHHIVVDWDFLQQLHL